MIPYDYSTLIKVGNICILSILCNSEGVQANDVLFELPVSAIGRVPLVLLTNDASHRLQCAVNGNKVISQYPVEETGLVSLSGVVVFVTN